MAKKVLFIALLFGVLTGCVGQRGYYYPIAPAYSRASQYQSIQSMLPADYESWSPEKKLRFWQTIESLYWRNYHRDERIDSSSGAAEALKLGEKLRLNK